MTSQFWTRTTWLMTLAAMASCIAWVLTRESSAGWLTLLLAVAAIAASYLAIDEQEGDEVAGEPHPLDPYPEELRRRLALGRLQDRAPPVGDEERGL